MSDENEGVRNWLINNLRAPAGPTIDEHSSPESVTGLGTNPPSPASESSPDRTEEISRGLSSLFLLSDDESLSLPVTPVSGVVVVSPLSGSQASSSSSSEVAPAPAPVESFVPFLRQGFVEGRQAPLLVNHPAAFVTSHVSDRLLQLYDVGTALGTDSATNHRKTAFDTVADYHTAVATETGMRMSTIRDNSEIAFEDEDRFSFLCAQWFVCGMLNGRYFAEPPETPKP